MIQINKQEYQTLIAKHKNILTLIWLTLKVVETRVFKFKSHIIIIVLSFSSINGNLNILLFLDQL